MYMTGAAAAELTGQTIAEIDAAAASGAIPAHYSGWMLLVDVEAPADSPGDDGPAPEVELVESWSDCTVADLKAELDEREIPYPSKAVKADLVALLDADDEVRTRDEAP